VGFRVEPARVEREDTEPLADLRRHINEGHVFCAAEAQSDVRGINLERQLQNLLRMFCRARFRELGDIGGFERHRLDLPILWNLLQGGYLMSNCAPREK